MQTDANMAASVGQPGGAGATAAKDVPPTTPLISVVVPTYNRLPRLERVLAALARQTLDPSSFEIVVVSDGSTDDTDAYLAERAPVDLVWARQPNGGPSAARNLGAQLARADLILFVDDDIIAAPDLVAQHLRCHQAHGAGLVVIGPMLTPPDMELSPWVRWEQAMLYKQYDAIRRGAFDATFRQFYTGNASLARSLLAEVGGFDTGMRRAEDVELGYRLSNAGCTFRFEPKAIGYHHAERSFDSWLRIAEDYGANDAALSDQPGKADMVSMARREFRGRHPLTQLLAMFCVGHVRIQSASRTLFRNLATVASRWGFERLSQVSLSAIYGTAYYCSMADQLGGRTAFYRRIVRPAPINTLKKLLAMVWPRRGRMEFPTNELR